MFSEDGLYGKPQPMAVDCDVAQEGRYSCVDKHREMSRISILQPTRFSKPQQLSSSLPGLFVSCRRRSELRKKRCIDETQNDPRELGPTGFPPPKSH